MLIMTLALIPKPFPDAPFRRKNMRRMAQNMIHELKKTDASLTLLQQMEQSLGLILQIEPFPDREYEYIGALSKPHHAAVFYTMRPTPYYVTRLKEISDHVIPKNLDPGHSFGLPIRASDKCDVESESPSFEYYMKVMQQIWTKHQQHFSKKKISIIVTTESRSVLDNLTAFQASSAGMLPFQYNFVVNGRDVMHGSGLPTNYKHESKEEIMLSMVSSLQAQLNAGYSVGNCCSSLHLLLFDFLRDGCGAATNSWNQCLQDNENVEFKVCCQWTSTDVCKAKRRKREKST